MITIIKAGGEAKPEANLNLKAPDSIASECFFSGENLDAIRDERYDPHDSSSNWVRDCCGSGRILLASKPS